MPSKATTPVVCWTCGGTFCAWPNKVRSGRAKFCSPSCRNGYCRPMAERLWPKIDKNGPVPEYAPELGPCWIWTGACSASGYGHLGAGGHDGKTILAHVVVYEQCVGPIPDGLELDHLCRVRRCCRPDHVEPVSHQINVLRGASVAAVHAQKTHCANGHLFDDKNTRYSNGGRWRACRACDRSRKAAASH